MVKFTATTEKRGTLIGLGITAGNLNLLKQGKPIHVFFADLNLPWKGEIMIMYGETVKDIQEELSEFITPDTIVHTEKEPT